MKSIYAVSAAIALTAALAGCDTFQSKEQACLESVRLNFKDPDSLMLVKNLGRRGQTAKEGDTVFWLRHKAKNSYGAYTSENMACHKSLAGKWERATIDETIAVQIAYGKLLDENIKGWRELRAWQDNCKTGMCNGTHEPPKPAEGIEQLKDMAKKVVYEGLADLN